MTRIPRPPAALALLALAAFGPAACGDDDDDGGGGGGGGGGGDSVNVYSRALDGGRLHFGSTTVNGERNLRLVVTAPDTGDATLRELLQVLRGLLEPAVARAG
jgi:hypothetical protein